MAPTDSFPTSSFVEPFEDALFRASSPGAVLPAAPLHWEQPMYRGSSRHLVPGSWSFTGQRERERERESPIPLPV